MLFNCPILIYEKFSKQTNKQNISDFISHFPGMNPNCLISNPVVRNSADYFTHEMGEQINRWSQRKKETGGSKDSR